MTVVLLSSVTAADCSVYQLYNSLADFQCHDLLVSFMCAMTSNTIYSLMGALSRCHLRHVGDTNKYNTDKIPSSHRCIIVIFVKKFQLQNCHFYDSFIWCPTLLLKFL